MDDLKFDSVARQIATSASRRSLLRGMAAGALGAIGLRQTGAFAQDRERVTICHLTPRGDYRQISVIPEAVRTHEEHSGDTINPDFASNENCGGCGIVCPEGQTCGGNGTPGVCAEEPGIECPLFYISSGDQCLNPCEATLQIFQVVEGMATNTCYPGTGACVVASGTRDACPASYADSQCLQIRSSVALFQHWEKV